MCQFVLNWAYGYTVIRPDVALKGERRAVALGNDQHLPHVNQIVIYDAVGVGDLRHCAPELKRNMEQVISGLDNIRGVSAGARIVRCSGC